MQALLLPPNVEITSASVRTVTTVSSPGEGTTLTEVINKKITDLIPVIKIPPLSNTTLAPVAVYGIDKVNSSLLSKPINGYVFDIGLNQWTNSTQTISKPAYDLLLMPSTLQGVTDCQAISRKAKNKTLARTCDLSRYDLSSAGAPDVTLNMIGNSSPNTYYFSIATRAPNDLQTTVDELYSKTLKQKGEELTTAQKITALSQLPLSSISSVAKIAISYASSKQNLGTIALRLQNPILEPSILTNPPLITAGISTSLIADAVNKSVVQSIENRLTQSGAPSTIDANTISAWRDNDAVVNTYSMINPYMKPSDLVKNYQLGINNGNLACPKTKAEIADKLPLMMSNPQLSVNNPNSWNFVCLLDGFDHMDSVGWLYTKDGESSADYMLEFYTRYIQQLEKL